MSTSPAEDISLIASFNKEARTYDIRLGNATRSISNEIIDLLFPLLKQPSTSTEYAQRQKRYIHNYANVLDVACGTGAFSLSLADRCMNSASPIVKSIWATDIAPAMVALMSTSAQDRGLLKQTATGDTQIEGNNQGNTLVADSKMSQATPAIYTAVCDGQDYTRLFPIEGVFDLIITNFGIFFFPDPAKGAAEMYRLLADNDGAAAVATCWHQMGSWPIFLEAQRRIAPAQPMESQRMIDQWKDGTKLEATLRDAGFVDVVLEQRKVVQWAYGITALSQGIAELIRGMVATNWTPEEMESGRLAGVVEETLREKGDEYLTKVDGDDSSSENAKIGYSLIAWIAIARKTAPKLSSSV